MVEKEAQAGAREALEPADQSHKSGDEPLLLLSRQLEPAPALGQPDVVAAGDQLKRDQDGDDLEHMRDPSGRQRERRNGEQEHEEDRETLLLEELDQAPHGLVALGSQPAFELVADSLRLSAWPPRATR
jgi:hypothetical protein